MVVNILILVVNSFRCKLVCYDVFYVLSNIVNIIIGRVVYIVVFDLELFIEKFLIVVGLRYFK